MKCLATIAAFVLGLVGISQAQAATVEGIVTPLERAQEVEVCSAATIDPQRCAVPGEDGMYELNHFPERGVVRSGVSDVEVCAIPQSPSVVTSCAETDASGGYEIHSLPPGFYKVGFWGSGSSAAYEPSYFLGKPSLAQATPVEVTAGTKTSGIDASLVRGAQLAGTVTAQADGEALEGMSVCLFELSGLTAQRCTKSAGDGTYSFQGLTDGTYQVGFALQPAEVASGDVREDGYAFQAQYYDDVATRSAATDILAIAPERTERIDTAMTAPAALPPPPSAPPSSVLQLLRRPPSPSRNQVRHTASGAVGNRRKMTRPVVREVPRRRESTRTILTRCEARKHGYSPCLEDRRKRHLRKRHPLT
jgi:hypothetical protein